MKTLKRFRNWFYIKLGLTYVLCKFKDGKNTITVESNGWVIISDGKSKDALPLVYCSESLVERVIKEMNNGD